jgi:autotransporter translocation and assembly factor TamB
MLDLAMANPILAAGGRRVRGRLTPDIAIGGTIAVPRVTGTAQLAGGEVEDAAAGLHLSDIVARVQGDGNTLRIAQFSAKAGAGTLGGGGTIGVLSPGLPLDLTLTARNAKPLSSDLISAELDADLTIRGEALGQLTVAGTLHVRRADLRVPERLPSSIAVLAGRCPLAKPRPHRPAPPMDVALNVTLDTPEQIFIRGRGLDGVRRIDETNRHQARQALGSPQPAKGVPNLPVALGFGGGVTLMAASPDPTAPHGQQYQCQRRGHAHDHRHRAQSQDRADQRAGPAAG